MKKVVYIILLISLSLSCQKAACEGAVKAEFKDLSGLDGCGMLIELGNGKRLEPLNLNEFNIDAQDGKKIWVKYEKADGASVCMAGEIIKIKCISDR